ncbi:MAG: hypothetical protein WD648_05150, partial [Planctomycetaceae bacterium]
MLIVPQVVNLDIEPAKDCGYQSIHNHCPATAVGAREFTELPQTTFELVRRGVLHVEVEVLAAGLRSNRAGRLATESQRRLELKANFASSP